MKTVRFPKTRRQLYLEHLEERLLLDANLSPGQWTYFDLNSDNLPSAGDAFFGLASTSTGMVTIVADAAGKTAPTAVLLTSGGSAKLIFNQALPPVSDIAGASNNLNFNHTQIDYDGSGISAQGLSATTYVAAGPGLLQGPALAGTYGGDIGAFTFGIAGTLTGQIVNFGAGNVGAFSAPTRDLTNFSILARGPADTFTSTVGAVTVHSWSGGELDGSVIGAFTSGGALAAGNVSNLNIVSATTIGAISTGNWTTGEIHGTDIAGFTAGNPNSPGNVTDLSIFATGNVGPIAAGTWNGGELHGAAFGTITIGNLLANGAVTGLTVSSVGAIGAVTVGSWDTGSIAGASMGNFTTGTLTNAGNVSDLNILMTGAVGNIVTGNWTNGLIQAASVGTVTAGNFLAPGDYNNVSIAATGAVGAVSVGSWTTGQIQANSLGVLTLGNFFATGDAADFNLSVVGNIAGITLQGTAGNWATGTISAGSIGPIAVKGDITNLDVEVFAGAPGPVGNIGVGSWIGGKLHAGAVGTLTVAGDFDVDVLVTSIGAISVTGNVGGAIGDPFVVGSTIASLTIGGDLETRIQATGGDITSVLVKGSILRLSSSHVGELVATFFAGTGGSMGDIVVQNDMRGNIRANAVFGTTPGIINSITVGTGAGNVFEFGSPSTESIITADHVNTITIYGDVVTGSVGSVTQRLPDLTTLTITGIAYNLWIQGGAQTVQIGRAHFLTIGGFSPVSGALRTDVGSLQITAGNVANQLWLWGNVQTIDIFNGSAGNGTIFVDGNVSTHVAIQGSTDSVTLGQLQTGASLTIGRFLGETTGANTLDSYIMLTGAAALDQSNLISVGNNDFRLFSQGSLDTARVLTGDFNLTTDTGATEWNPATRDLFNPHPDLADPNHIAGEQMFNVVPDANPGSGFADGSGQHRYAGIVPWAPLSDGGYANYYYRGFRILDVADTNRTLGLDTYSQEFLTIKDTSGAAMEYPDVTFDIDQGRITVLNMVTDGHNQVDPGGAAGVESSIAVSTPINVTGNISFLYVHGDEAYRGNVMTLNVVANASGYGDLTGARLATYTTQLSGGNPLSSDDRHVVVAPGGDAPYALEISGQNLDLNDILGVYALNGSIGTVHVAGNCAGDIVSDFGGIGLVQIDSGPQHGNGYGLYSTILARTDTGNISRVRANSAFAYMKADTSDLANSGGARILAEGKLGIATDDSGFAGPASDPNSDWAIWIGQEGSVGGNGVGYVQLIRGSAGGARTRIHAEVNDLWSIVITGAQGFGAEDRIDLPYDNDLYLQVQGKLDWDPSTRNDFTRDANGYPTVNHVLLGQFRSAIGEAAGVRADWNIANPDVAVARRFTAVAADGSNLYLFNEGFLAGGTTYDGDKDRIEFIQYVTVGGDTTVDQYLYKGQIDRIEFIAGPTGVGQGVAVLVTTNVFVPDNAGAGFNFFGRVLGTGANILLVATEGNLREARALNGNNLVGVAFGITLGGFGIDPKDGVKKVLGFLTLTGPFQDWDGDGSSADPTAVISFRGSVQLVSTTGAVSVLGGDVVAVANQPIENIDVSVDAGSVIDVMTGGDVVNVNIRGAGGTLTVKAGGTVSIVQTTGSIDTIIGSSQGVNTLISAAGTIKTVEITHGVWQVGDRIIAGAGSDVYVTDVDGFTDGTVTLLGIATGGGNTPDTAPLSFWLFEDTTDDYDMWVYEPDGTLIRYFDFNNYVQDTISGAGPDRVYFPTPLAGTYTIKIQCYSNNNPGVPTTATLKAYEFGTVTSVLATIPLDGSQVSSFGDPNSFVGTATFDYQGGLLGESSSTHTLLNFERVGDARYYYVTQAYAAGDKVLTPTPYAQVDLNSGGQNDQTDVTFTTRNGVLNTVQFDDNSGLAPAGVDRLLTITSTDPMNALTVNSIGVGNVRPLVVDSLTPNSPDLYLAAADFASFGWNPVTRELGTKLTPPLIVPPTNSFAVTLDNTTFFAGPTAFNHLFYTQGAGLELGDVELTAPAPVVGSVLMSVTIAPNPATGLRFPQSLSFEANTTAPAPELSLNAVNTDVGDLTFSGDVGTITILGGAGDTGNINIGGHLNAIHVRDINGVFNVANGVDVVDVVGIGLQDGLVPMTWGGVTHLVAPANLFDPKALTNPAFVVIPFNALFANDITVSGQTVNFGGVNVYANVLMDNTVENLLNLGGTFFGSISGSIGTTVQLIEAKSFGTGGYTNGANGVDERNQTTGAFDDTLLNQINIPGSLVDLIATDNLYAEVNVQGGDLISAQAGGNIDFGSGLTVFGAIGSFTPVTGTPPPPSLAGPDGQLYTHDDAVTGIIAGGSIVGPITAGGTITNIHAGGNLGRANEWASAASDALNRNLITAVGEINVIQTGGNLYSRINVTGTGGLLDFLIVNGDVLSAEREAFTPGPGGATNTDAAGAPIIAAAKIGLFGVRGQTSGAATSRIASGSFFDWTDEAGVAHELGVTGGDATVDLAFGNVVRVGLNASNATVDSNGDLGIVTNSGSLSVITGAVRKQASKTDPVTGVTTVTTLKSWVTPDIKSQPFYGTPTDKVFTTGVTAGVLGVESLRGNVTKVVSTGPVGSVVADRGSVTQVLVVDNTLGLTVAGEEFTLAGPGRDQSVFAAGSVGLVRVVSSTATLDTFGVSTPITGTRSMLPWLLGSVASGGTLGEVSVERLGDGSLIQGGKGVNKVQVVVGTGGIIDFTRVEAVTGNVGTILTGAAKGNTVIFTADCLLDIVADAGKIGTVTATGDILSSIGSRTGTTSIGTIQSLGGSIGRRGQSPAPVLAAAGKINVVKASGDIFADIAAGSLGTVTSETGAIGGPGITIHADGAIQGIAGTRGIGAKIEAGGNLGFLKTFGGVLTGDVTVGGTLSAVAIIGLGGAAIQSNVTVGKGINSLNLSNGSLSGTVTVSQGAIKSMTLDNGAGDVLTGTVNVSNGAVNSIKATGNLGGTLNIAKGIVTLSDVGLLNGTINVAAGGIGTITVTGNIAGAAISAATGLIKSVTVHGSYNDSNIIANQLGKILVDGTIRSLVPPGDVIHALNGASSFTVQDSTKSVVVSAANNNQTFGGVTASVG